MQDMTFRNSMKDRHMRIIHSLKIFLEMLRREKIVEVCLIVCMVTLLGSAGFVYFEKDIGFTDALWWSVVTLTTVGYGDISPHSPGGRIVGILVMVSGIGFLGVLTASIASIFVEKKFLENKGMKPADVKNHFIICGWNFRGHKVIEELRADSKCGDLPIVIIADIPEKPLDDSGVWFVCGEVETEILEKACIGDAQGVIVLSDDGLDAYSRDAKAILNTLTIKSMNARAYICVELMDEKNIRHCRRAGADEIIVAGELSTNLLVQAALDHGITRLMVSNRYGEELYKINLPPHLAGKTFFDILCALKAEHGVLCVGIETAEGRRLITNPARDYVASPDDQLIVIAAQRPQI